MNPTMNDVAAKATRRSFALRLAGGACAVACVPGAAWSATRVEEADETAVALGYKHDTKKVDAKKYPKHAATQRCNNCGLWQGAAADPWAGCSMFGRKHIAAEGWCMAWVQKPG
ncbi:high-potential iron-sulfur protein [Variovorax sp. KK3]|uniref:high-potential iron-sulfur protein n=1 Tax=Variovorax sp. KK3 TaxID=1855728 RepID=UPI00097C5E94|nr:high-potential iron-sulfur protein [Variovorax sp. KK3]